MAIEKLRSTKLINIAKFSCTGNIFYNTFALKQGKEVTWLLTIRKRSHLIVDKGYSVFCPLMITETAYTCNYESNKKNQHARRCLTIDTKQQAEIHVSLTLLKESLKFYLALNSSFMSRNSKCSIKVTTSNHINKSPSRTRTNRYANC